MRRTKHIVHWIYGVVFLLLICLPDSVVSLVDELNGVCPSTPSESGMSTLCTIVADWEDLKRVVKIANRRNNTMLLLCPFHIMDKEMEDSIVITSSMYIGCSETHQCIIDGGGTHFAIEGDSTSSIIQGLVFRGASKPAIRVLSSTQNGHQMICHCNFIFNRISDERGGSIKTEEQTSVTIGFSLFEQNRGIEGSAIYNRGRMDISHSTFIGNVASRIGGAVKNSKAGRLSLQFCTFKKNEASWGAAVATVGVRTRLDLGGNVVSQNVGRCSDGYYDSTDNKCRSFDDFNNIEIPELQLPRIFQITEDKDLEERIKEYRSQPKWGNENVASRVKSIMDYLSHSQDSNDNRVGFTL